MRHRRILIVAPPLFVAFTAGIVVVLGVATGALAVASPQGPGAATASSPPSSSSSSSSSSSALAPPVTTGGPATAAAPPSGTEPASRSSANPVPPTSETDRPVAPAPDLAAAPVAEAAAVPVPVRDAAATASDHDAVVGAWGIVVRPVATTLPVFARRASTGCPGSSTNADTGVTTTTTGCPSVSVSTLAVRHWLTRSVGLDAGAALALGGGEDNGRLLDSYFGLGPTVGMSVLIGNWRHLAVAASPSLAVVVFKAAGSTDTSYLAELRADLEGELHFGFVGVPALSLGIRSGVLFRLEHAAEVSLWSAGVSGATSVRSLLADLLLRYYF